ncbi:MAG: peptidylprolyl isomerase [Chloroflexota bacterium]|nr:peptidylprolyl isomerase [Chloroflexota bacterium]
MSNRPKNPANGPTKKPSGTPATRPTAGRPTAGNVRITPTRPQARRGVPPPPPPNNMTRNLMIGGVLLAGIIALALLFVTNNAGTPTAAATPTASTSAAAAVGAPGANNNTPSVAGAAGVPNPVAATGSDTKGAIALVQTTKGNFKIQLFSDPAVTGTVKNFTDKVKSGYFDGKIFHRVEGFVIQGGDPTGSGSGGGNIPGEYSKHSFVTGAVGMASTASRAAQVNDSQWFVVKTDSLSLDDKYDIFGHVIEGMDVVNQIAIGDKMTKITMQP